MALVCGECGSQAGDNAKFCAECGAKLPRDGTDDVRKTVSVLFCDLVGSTSIGERTDPESLRALLERYFGVMRAALERHGGTVEKFIGDAVVAFFGVPTSREDDALRAVRSAFDMQRGLAELNPELLERWGLELAVRIGVNTGEVLVSGTTEHMVGDAVNVAARLEQAAAAGEVLVGETTWRLVREWADGEPLTPLELKGKEETVPAWRVRSVAGVTQIPHTGTRLRARLVGRDRELAMLRQCFERIEADRSCQLLTIFGAPGMGKTRLSNEFLATQPPRVRVIRSRCLSYGDGTSLWPLLEMLRASAGLQSTEEDEAGRVRLAEVFGDDADAGQAVELLAPLAGLGGIPAAIEEVQWAVRRYLEALARSGPTIWVVEDLHWAESAFLSIVEDVVDWTREAALMVMCLARPEFLDDHPTWGGGKLNVINMLVKPLSASDSTDLVSELLGGAGLPREALDRVVVAAGGTPLFVEQLLAMFMDDGLLSHDPDGWHIAGDLESLAVPATIGALLAARLERLSSTERQVLAAGAVVGQLFYAGAAVELSGLDPQAVAESLRSLTRKEMVRPERSDIRGEEGYAFTHMLLRDSAYQAMSKLRRADLHERLARWLDKRAGALAGEADDFVAHHLTEAVTLRRSLGDIDESVKALAEEATTRLAVVAGRLLATDALSAADLYASAAGLVQGTLTGLDLRRRQGIALLRAQQFGRARSVLDSVLAEIPDAGDRGLLLRSRLAWLDVAAHTEGELTMAAINSTVAEALRYFHVSGDDEGLALAYSLSRKQLNMEGLWEPMVEVSDKVMYHAARCGDQLLFNEAQAFRYAAMFYGPRHRDEVLELLQREADAGETTRLAGGTRRMVEAMVLGLADRPSQARAALADARSTFDEMHSPLHLLHLRFCAAILELILDDDVAAEHELMFLFEELNRSGERSYLSTVVPLLGEIRLRQGNLAAAAELAAMGHSLALEEDVSSQGLWRIVMAKVVAREGDFDRAQVLATEAVEWMERSDQLQWTGDVHAGRAEVQVLAGHLGDARNSLERALELYDAKGDIRDSRRVRQRLDDIASA